MLLSYLVLEDRLNIHVYTVVSVFLLDNIVLMGRELIYCLLLLLIMVVFVYCRTNGCVPYART